jgi:hypothetical protein
MTSLEFPLPRGVWYEDKYKRFRVRLYRSGKAHRAGYFKTRAAAEAALVKLKKKLKKLKKAEKTTSPLRAGSMSI